MDETQGWADFDSYIGMARRAVNAEKTVEVLKARIDKLEKEFVVMLEQGLVGLHDDLDLGED